ncbi:MAG: TIR domain-containing protein [Acidobacteria bacterium]|nr:TIR domain-containing protein [Acidobacteriota bacterium]MBI3657876.1 TIR domain-containing protein [Acidobacteriota bacterium]
MARRVFFSFHYQDVIDFRANIVRNHNVTKDDNAGYFDASIWESAKRQGDVALKRLINGGLDNTSVTVVLIGTQTYARRWVRYEIMKSIERGNKVIGVHINGIPDKNQQVKTLGPNPFDYLGLQISTDGIRGTPTVWNGMQWVYYKDLEGFEIAEQPWDKRGKHFQLSHWLRTYDWVANNGFHNFGTWVA